MDCRCWVCAPGQKQLKAGGCVTFIQHGRGSYKDDDDQLVDGWIGCNGFKVQPGGHGLDIWGRLPKSKVGHEMVQAVKGAWEPCPWMASRS